MNDSRFKRRLIAIYERLYEARRILLLRTKYRLHIMSSEETIRYILKTHCSVARYGDGEFKLMMDIADIGFQKRDAELSEKLRQVLDEHRDSMLICAPSTFNSVRGCNEFARRFWIDWGKSNDNQVRVVNMLRKHCGRTYLFGDATMTRTYIDWKSDRRAKRLFPLLKKLWDSQDVLFVEGKQTRLGVGNDLFSNTKSIQRILAPAKNAFVVYDEIRRTVMKHGKGKLILLALGPTATILANDLDKSGYRALDIGHIDIEYEWYLQGVEERIAIPGKFTNEAKDGRDDIANCEDKVYLSQIIDRVGC